MGNEWTLQHVTAVHPYPGSRMTRRTDHMHTMCSITLPLCIHGLRNLPPAVASGILHRSRLAGVLRPGGLAQLWACRAWGPAFVPQPLGDKDAAKDPSGPRGHACMHAAPSTSTSAIMSCHGCSFHRIPLGRTMQRSAMRGAAHQRVRYGAASLVLQ